VTSECIAPATLGNSYVAVRQRSDQPIRNA
jgi:hypothetical protein